MESTPLKSLKTKILAEPSVNLSHYSSKHIWIQKGVGFIINLPIKPEKWKRTWVSNFDGQCYGIKLWSPPATCRYIVWVLRPISSRYSITHNEKNLLPTPCWVALTDSIIYIIITMMNLIFTDCWLLAHDYWCLTQFCFLIWPAWIYANTLCFVWCFFYCSHALVWQKHKQKVLQHIVYWLCVIKYKIFYLFFSFLFCVSLQFAYNTIKL